MSGTTIAALATGIAALIGAVTTLVATWRHITGPAHQGPRRP